MGVAIGRFDNPVLTRETRTRMRGTRAYWMLFFYVMLQSLILFVAYLLRFQRYQGYAAAGYQPVPGMDPAGRELFQALFVAQALMIAVITPALTAGMLTIEREQRTFELLMLTMLRPRQIIAGKLCSAFGFAVLLLTASLPLAGICLMLNGISPEEILVVYLLLAASSLFYGALGILFSAVLRSTAMATAASYMAGLFLFLLTGIAALGTKEVLFSSVNPVGAVFNALESAPFFRWRLATWIPALPLLVLLALLAASGATHRLEEGLSERPGVLRWLTYLIFCILAIGAVGNVLGGVRPSSVDQVRLVISWTCMILLVLLAVLALVFCTGEGAEVSGAAASVRPAPRRVRLGRLFHARIFTGGYAWGFAYTLLLFITAAAALVAGFSVSGSSTWVLAADALGEALLLVFSALMCYIALGRFYSVLLGARYAAAMLGFFTITALALLPLLNLLAWDPAVNPGHQILWETLYLNPGVALLSLCTDAPVWSRTYPAVWSGQQLMWVVAAALHLGLAAVLELAGQGILAGRRRVKA